MIAKLLFPIVLVILLTTFYLDHVYWRGQWRYKRYLGWGVAIFGMYATIAMAITRDYFPDSISTLFWYLHFLCIVVVPAALFAICLLVGRKLKNQRRGEWTGLALGLICILLYLYGTFIGSTKLEVTEVGYINKDIPKAFHGYRIVQFSDVHAGSFSGSRQEVLRKAVNMINAQQPDLVVFSGDLQNKRPEEIAEHRQLLSSIRARDGVVAVLGNHDYAEYQGGTKAEKARSCEQTVKAIRELGWTLLRNEHIVIRRGNDSIVIAGMENDGEGRFPQKGDVQKTMQGVSDGAFVVMVEHDPTSWRRKIVPYCNAQLTLSGHTHGGQFAVFGWSPACFRYDEYNGRYDNGRHTLYVTKGLGGVIPFRLGCPGEIVVITLQSP